MPSISLNSMSGEMKLDSPVHVVDLPHQVQIVEFSPFQWSQNVILLAFPSKLSIGSIIFQEDDDSMDSKYKLSLLQDFSFEGRAHALALSAETLLTSNPVIQAACASSNFKIYLFESKFKTSSETKELIGHTDYVNDICFDKGSALDECFEKESSVEFIASVSDDCTCRLWSLKDLQNSFTFYLESPGTAVKWSPGEPNKLLVAEKKGVIRLYNVDQEMPVMSLESDMYPLMDVDWSRSNHCKISGVAQGYLLIWNTNKSTFPVHKQLVHSQGSKCVRYCNQNENIVATVGFPGHTLHVTNIKTKFPINVAKLKVIPYIDYHALGYLNCRSEDTTHEVEIQAAAYLTLLLKKYIYCVKTLFWEKHV